MKKVTVQCTYTFDVEVADERSIQEGSCPSSGVVGVAFKNAMKQEDDETEAMCWGCVLNGTTKVLKIQS